jgi:hypothetical protein
VDLHVSKRGGAGRFLSFCPSGFDRRWPRPFPSDGFFSGGLLDKMQKEALQAAKEMLAKFIETRTVSPNTFA